MSTVRVDTLATLDGSFSTPLVDLALLPARLTTAQAAVDKLTSSTFVTSVANANNFALVADQACIINGSYSVYLPTTAGLRVGSMVVLQKLAGTTPTVAAKIGDTIKFANGTTDTSFYFDVSSKIMVVWNGAYWEIFKCQQA